MKKKTAKKTRAPSISYQMGGDFNQYITPEGNYHVEVTDALIREAKSGRLQIKFELTVRGDPYHPKREGKKLTNLYVSFPHREDDELRRQTLKGFMKRLVFDGFGVPWPKKSAPIDPRIFLGKRAWVAVRFNPHFESTDVRAVAHTLDELPILITQAQRVMRRLEEQQDQNTIIWEYARRQLRDLLKARTKLQGKLRAARRIVKLERSAP